MVANVWALEVFLWPGLGAQISPLENLGIPLAFWPSESLLVRQNGTPGPAVAIFPVPCSSAGNLGGTGGTTGTGFFSLF